MPNLYPAPPYFCNGNISLINHKVNTTLAPVFFNEATYQFYSQTVFHPLCLQAKNTSCHTLYNIPVTSIHAYVCANHL